MSDAKIIASIIESVGSDNKTFGTTLKKALGSYSSYLNWLNYTTSKEVGRVQELVNEAMLKQGLWKGSGGIVQRTIKSLAKIPGNMKMNGRGQRVDISPVVYQRKYGVLKTYTYKHLGGLNELTLDDSGALVGGVTSYRQSGKSLVANQKIHDRLQKIKAVDEHKVYDDQGKVINKQRKGRDINAIVSLIEKQTDINIFSNDKFSKYPTSKKISAINQVMALSERSKKFSLENTFAGEILLSRFEDEIKKR